MITISSSYTLRPCSWTDWKTIQAAKTLTYNVQADPDIYWVYAYNTPECFITQIWRSTVPFGVITSGYTQEQNDTDKADFEANFKSGASIYLPIGG